MDNKLMYAGITHETAPAVERAYYAMSDIQKQRLATMLKEKLAIRALVILTTCNRTEVYFESATATPYQVREIIIDFASSLHKATLDKNAFLIFDCSIDTANHLLHVSNGLRSAVIGDKQIMTQVKAAYQHSLKQKNQGSLLERAFQAVFRSHKRIATESLYQRGSTSTAYSSLKMVTDYFGKETTENLSMLIVGAGEVAGDILKYLPKFNFRDIYISNRTAEKAIALANHYNIKTCNWKWVENGDFSAFDVVITAVSHRKHLIKKMMKCDKKRLWIDLAMPSNVDARISDDNNKVYNIDEVTGRVNAINEAQIKAIPVVEEILREELTIFGDWLKKDRLRAFLRSYKNQAKQTFLQMAPITLLQTTDVAELEIHAEKFANKLARKSARTLNQACDAEFTNQGLEIIYKAFRI